MFSLLLWFYYLTITLTKLIKKMFLLIVVSLLHLIDERDYEKSYDNDTNTDEKEDMNSLDNFDEKTLTDDFDYNTYKFLLSILFRFVKIFPSLVKFYYDESKNKLKNIFLVFAMSKLNLFLFWHFKNVILNRQCKYTKKKLKKKRKVKKKMWLK